MGTPYRYYLRSTTGSIWPCYLQTQNGEWTVKKFDESAVSLTDNSSSRGLPVERGTDTTLQRGDTKPLASGPDQNAVKFNMSKKMFGNVRRHLIPRREKGYKDWRCMLSRNFPQSLNLSRWVFHTICSSFIHSFILVQSDLNKANWTKSWSKMIVLNSLIFILNTSTDKI